MVIGIFTVVFESIVKWVRTIITDLLSERNVKFIGNRGRFVASRVETCSVPARVRIRLGVTKIGCDFKK